MPCFISGYSQMAMGGREKGGKEGRKEGEIRTAARDLEYSRVGSRGLFVQEV